MSWKMETIGDLLIESKIQALKPNPDKRIRVKLNIAGVEKRPLENEIAGATKQFIRKSGQFIYGKQNFHKGAFGIIPEGLDGYETSADIPSFDVRNDCLPEWIFYFFKIGNRYLELEKLARGVGSKRIHPDQLVNIRIPLPPLNEQRIYLSKFKNLEESITEVNIEHLTQLDLLKKLRQQILQDAIQGKLVPQDPNDEPANMLLETIKSKKEQLIRDKRIKKEKPLPDIKPQEIQNEIPENWSWCRLGEISLFSEGGKSYKASENIANAGEFGVIKTSAITSSVFNELENKRLPIQNTNYDKILIKEGDLLFCRASGSKGLAGKSCVVLRKPKANLILSDKSIRYVFPENIVTQYIQYFNSSNVAGIYYNQLGTGKSTSMNNITREQFDRLIIPLPPLLMQYRIVIKIEQLMRLCDELEQSIHQNQKYTQDLLQVALKEALKQEPIEIV